KSYLSMSKYRNLYSISNKNTPDAFSIWSIFVNLMAMLIGAFFFDWITTFYALDPGVNVD
ncbi:hypothetical protein, partial [Bacillus cereus group sp. BfR-BA-01492]|uniref:hypothetical protein n=1 Tax=Bacillus cereus group sp. BfR-BA-01492 TaxID=2920361 RepID=UPI001F57421C